MTDRVREAAYRFCMLLFLENMHYHMVFIIFIPVFFGRQSGIVFKNLNEMTL